MPQTEVPLIKLSIAGDQQVGKTVLTNKLDRDDIGDPEYKPTIGAEFSSYGQRLAPSNHKFKLQIWDTAGQKRFRYILRVYLNSADVIILVYNNQKSLDKLKEIYQENSADIQGKLFKEPVKLILFNDTGTAEEAEQPGRDFAQENDCAFARFNFKTATQQELRKFIATQLEAKIATITLSPNDYPTPKSIIAESTDNTDKSATKLFMTGLLSSSVAGACWYMLATGVLSSKVIGSAILATTLTAVAWPAAIIFSLGAIGLFAKSISAGCCNQTKHHDDDFTPQFDS